MPASSFTKTKINKKLFKFFDKAVIHRISKQTGFQQRKGGKISGVYFVTGFVLMCQKGCHSFSAWAEQISLLTGQLVTKQAVWERLYRNAEEFTGKLLQHYLAVRFVAEKTVACSTILKGYFCRIAPPFLYPIVWLVVLRGVVTRQDKKQSPGLYRYLMY
jgi:hypothetical protein